MADLESDAFVFFGPTGDLASKQIFPALQAMIRHGHLDIETLGIEGRGRFYEEVGVIRDVVQNHMLEVVALLTMGTPISRDSDGLRAERERAFRAMRPVAPHDAVCGQFRGYRNEKGVAPHSQVATFSAMKLYIDTWRWANVSFYLHSRRKRLPVTATEVLVQLKRPLQAVFDSATQGEGDYFRFRLSPHVSISLGARTKKTGEAMVGEPVELVVRQAPGDEMTPYERLLGDAIRGGATLFVRQDSVEAAWSVVDPILGNAMPFMNTNHIAGGQPKLTRSLPAIVAGTTLSQCNNQRKEPHDDAHE